MKLRLCLLGALGALTSCASSNAELKETLQELGKQQSITREELKDARQDIVELKKAIEQLTNGQETQNAALAKLTTKLDNLKPSAPAPRGGPDPAIVYGMPVGDSPSRGPADAWVTVIAVMDFQCPFCRRAAATLEEVEKHYGKDVRLVYKHNPLPFHVRAMPAALASECARDQQKFWQLYSALYDNQQALDDDAIFGYAEKAGIGLKSFRACIEKRTHEGRIKSDQDLAARFGARGTPAFYINGRFVSGAQPFENFKAVIDEVLAKAKDSGIPQADYYRRAVVEAGASKAD